MKYVGMDQGRDDDEPKNVYTGVGCSVAVWALITAGMTFGYFFVQNYMV